MVDDEEMKRPLVVTFPESDADVDVGVFTAWRDVHALMLSNS
jgi:hypothetical protein